MNSTNAGNRIIIAISGKQLSGKDAFAQLLLEKLPTFRRVGMGDAIKHELAKQKGITVEKIEKNKAHYRPALIELGNYGRTLDNGLYWIKKVLDFDGNLIVADMRMKKEYEIFSSEEAVLIRVNADRDVRASRGTLVNENDATECDLDLITRWDFVVDNNQGLENLCRQVNEIVSQLKLSS